MVLGHSMHACLVRTFLLGRQNPGRGHAAADLEGGCSLAPGAVFVLRHSLLLERFASQETKVTRGHTSSLTRSGKSSYVTAKPAVISTASVAGTKRTWMQLCAESAAISMIGIRMVSSSSYPCSFQLVLTKTMPMRSSQIVWWEVSWSGLQKLSRCRHA